MRMGDGGDPLPGGCLRPATLVSAQSERKKRRAPRWRPPGQRAPEAGARSCLVAGFVGRGNRHLAWVGYAESAGCPAPSALWRLIPQNPGLRPGLSCPGPLGLMFGLKGQDKIAQAEGRRRRPQAWDCSCPGSPVPALWAVCVRQSRGSRRGTMILTPRGGGTLQR